MALGGGTWTSQNKTLPGAYINFVSKAKVSSTLGDRGKVAIPMALDWGDDTGVMTVTAEDFEKSSQSLFGYGYDADAMRNLRELFRNAKTAYIYRVNGGVKASNTLGTAKWSGTRGNAIKIGVTANVDNAAKFDVKTYLDGVLCDSQTVAAATGLVDNDYVAFKTSATLAATAAGGLAMTGGTNTTPTGTQYQAALASFDPYSFNILACPVTDASTIALFVAYTKRMREDRGVKFQCVVPAMTTGADYEGVIEVANTVTDFGAEGAALVYWVSGAEAACRINASLTGGSHPYDGEYTVNVDYTQTQLEGFISAGKLAMHRVGDAVWILKDINTLISTTAEKGVDFKANQTIRVIDEDASDIASIFATKYLGRVPNDTAGQSALWGDIVAHRKEMRGLRAIENFSSKDITVVSGETKDSVIVSAPIQPVNCMDKLYMTVVVK